jgi:serine/threonine protein kinase
MAEVFAGQSMGSHGFQKPVAIKRLLPELANDHVFVERLIGEAKLLVGMQHGNIVSVLDLARDGDDVFLVMEFMDGPSVRQLLKARGTRGLPIGVATYIVQMAATGLEFAHGRPGGAVIHADISPSNILLTTSGEVRVADFGIARREGNGIGVVEGKWAYMAPEQARGESLTPRSDVFALGVVLYELICGQHPLGRQVTADERESAPLHVIPPRVVKPSIPPGIEAICMRALAHDPRDRYARMQQLIDALVEERFACGWREGANDLASVIREVIPGAGSPNAGPKTQHTDRPVTIVTRSLISQSAAKRARMSSPKLAGIPDEPHGDLAQGSVDVPPPAPIFESGAQTRMVFGDQVVAPDPVAPVPQQLLALSAAMLPAPELASVHGGNTFTGGAVAIGERGSPRWTFGVLGAAAAIGAVAAVALQLGPSKSDDPIATPRPVIEIKAPPVNKLEQTRPSPPPPVVAAPVVHEVAPPPVAKSQPPKTDSEKTESLESKLASQRSKSASAKPTVTARPTPTKGARGTGEAFIQFEEWNGGYMNVSVGGQSSSTPRPKFYVAAGAYTVVIRDNDNEKFTCRVSLEPGMARHVHVSLEERSCSE